MQNNTLPPGLSGPELTEWLEVQATDTRITDYSRPLTADELNEKNRQFVDNSVAMASADEKLALARSLHKAEMNDLKATGKNLMKQIKTKMVEELGTVYIFRDLENGRVYEYTKYGQLITSRPLMPEERQHIIPLNTAKTA